MKSIPWHIGASIPFFLDSDCADKVAEHLGKLNPDRLLCCVDPAIWKIHGRSYEDAFAKISPLQVIHCPSSESAKSLAEIESFASRLIFAGATRQSILVAFGGGVVGNCTGLAAGLLFRGMRFVHLPTTFLAMHDSVTSFKQGVNCSGVKNILGLFHAPSAIYIDLRFIDSLSPAQLRAGLAELVKNALILGGDYASSLSYKLPQLRSAPSLMLYAQLIQRGIQAKQLLMQNDPHERGPALALEYGHTIGHALELAYSGELSHGDAIAWGMHCAASVAVFMNYMTPPARQNHDALLSLLGDLPRPREFYLEEIQCRLWRDNKRGYLPAGGENHETLTMILLHAPGQIVRDGAYPPLTLVPRPAIDFALAELRKRWLQ